jgi:hypothetical protein
MRYWIFLGIVTALPAPANLYAQVERAAQAGKPAPTSPTEKATPCPPSVIHQEMPVTRSVLALSYKPGQSLIVRMNNQRERVGKLSEIQSDYFLLTSSKGTEKIAYINVAAVREWSLRWRIGKILMMPIKAPVYATVYGGFYTLVGIGYFGEWITGHRSK